MYNILLRVYISNDHTFSPSEFLENMEKDNISPNDVSEPHHSCPIELQSSPLLLGNHFLLIQGIL